MSSMHGSKDKSIQQLEAQSLNKNKATLNKSRVSGNRPSAIAPYYQHSVIHPNFDPNQTPLDPNRPLSDIPNPVRREQAKLKRIFNDTNTAGEDASASVKSAQDLLVSPSLASHFELLKAGNLIDLPSSFTIAPNNAHTYPLLQPLLKINLLDMSDIFKVQQQIKQDGYVLSRYGVCKRWQKHNNPARLPSHTKADGDGYKDTGNTSKVSDKQRSKTVNSKTVNSQVASNLPEMINDVFAPEWELILYPENFDNGVDSLQTDTLACSVAVHVLKQCQTRKSMNKSLTAKQICQHMRSYMLSQCRLYPHKCERYRQIRLFEGHVIVAAYHLGLNARFVKNKTDLADLNAPSVESTTNCKVYFNISSRNSLFVRYPDISSYFINGWQ